MAYIFAPTMFMYSTMFSEMLTPHTMYRDMRVRPIFVGFI